MKKLLSLLLILTSLSIYSQKEANFWYFGENAGIDFTSGSPVALTNGSLSTFEGSATISDANGNLLFYTDGSTVYDKNGDPMVNGTGLLGDPSSAQSAIIVPKPLDPTIYYIFTVGREAGGGTGDGNGVQYSEVSIPSGSLGEVTVKNTPLINTAFEKITSIKGEDCNTFWVITADTNRFYAYKIDKDGVNTTAIQSPYTTTGLGTLRGYLKISPDGKTLVNASNFAGSFIFDFNTQNGTATNERTLNVTGSGYGVEFSRNSKKLYITTGVHGQGPNPPTGTANIFQYSLDANNDNTIDNITDINNSRQEVYSTSTGHRGALQLGPNGKIYYAKSGQTSLGVINSPEKDATNVDFDINGVDLSGRVCREGLPPFIQSFFLPINVTDNDTGIVLNNQNLQYCTGENKTITIPTNVTPATGTSVEYIWSFNDGTNPVVEVVNTMNYANSNLVLTNLQTNDSGDYKLEVKYEDVCGNDIVNEATFNIQVFESAVATQPTVAPFCDTNLTDTPHVFDLKAETETQILNGLSDTTFEVLYFTDPDDAMNNVTANAITTFTDAANSIFEQTIHARVHNKGAPNSCYALTTFVVKTTGLPTPQDPTDYLLCDDVTSAGGNTDGVTESFRLADYDESVILGALDPATYSITYHSTLNGAQTDNTMDVVDKNINISNATYPKLYVRVENNGNSNCFDASKELNLVVAKVPSINATAEIRQCVASGLPNTTLNLTIANKNVTNEDLSDSKLKFEYYTDNAGTNLITNFQAYPVNVGAVTTVYVKTILDYGAGINCSDVGLTQLDIHIDGVDPLQGYTNTFDAVCDDFLDADGNDTPGSNSDTDFITNFPKIYFDQALTGINVPNTSQVFFYENQTDRTNSVNEIDINNYRNDITKIDRTDIAGGIQFPIYYKIISTINNDCQGLGQFYFQINSVPEATTPSNFDLCDDFDSGQFNDGINTGINLREKVGDILGASQTETDFDVTFYRSEADANSGSNAIPFAETENFKNDTPVGWVTGTVSTQTIYVRVQNKTTGCFNDHVSFDININPLPTITNTIPDIEVCDTPSISDSDPRNGLAQGINLSQRDADVLNGRLASEYKVSYHRTRDQATAGLVSTELNKNSYDNNPNFTTLTNGIGEETLYISIKNITTGCTYGISTLKIIVYPEPNIPSIIDNYSTCDHDNNGLGDDTDGIVEDIALINKKEQVLANYPTTEHDNFKVTFHTSKALAESGGNPIDENKYKNTQNNQIIYVRVEDTRTGCVNDDLTFEIIINPLPTYDEIDTPQIVCLNNLPLRIEIQNALTSYSYTWKDENGNTLNTNPDDDFLDITKGGNYSVTATMKDGTGCERTREFRINESNIATITDADVSIVDDSDNNSITIDTTNLGIGDYEFALFDKVTNSFVVDYQDEPFFNDLKGGIYSIYVRDKNGCDINNIPVELEVPVVEFPKFFTPNGDGDNDVWSIKGVNAFFFPGSTIYIFNRYGKVVGNISVNNNSWDGTYKGKPLPSDDYWFNIQLINKDGTPRKPRKGHFSLLRKQ